MTISAVKFLPVAVPTRARGMRSQRHNRNRRFTAASAACCAVLLLLVQAPGCKGAHDVVTPPSVAADLASHGLQIPANLEPVAPMTASETMVMVHLNSAAANWILGATAACDGLAAAHYRGRRLAAEAAEPQAALLMTSSVAAASTKQSGELQCFGSIALGCSRFGNFVDWSR